jgi:hypothetical protein
MMAIETAAAILTKLAFEQNHEFRSRLSSAKADENTLVALIVPLFRRILSQLQEDHQAFDKFPTSIGPSPSDKGH